MLNKIHIFGATLSSTLVYKNKTQLKNNRQSNTKKGSKICTNRYELNSLFDNFIWNG